MTIYEYIDRNLPNLNWNILPQIFEYNGVELTEKIEKYLRETPENTNLNIINNMINSGGKDTGEVWFVGNNSFENGGRILFELQQVNQTYSFEELVLNSEEYIIFLNGQELSGFTQVSETNCAWFDNEIQEEPTMGFMITWEVDSYTGAAIYLNSPTVPTSVEVSVKRK